MNKALQYAIIFFSSVIMIIFLYLFLSIANNGLSIQFLKPYLHNKLLDKFENSSLDFDKGILIYSANSGIQLNIDNFQFNLDDKDSEIIINKIEIPISCIFPQISNRLCNIQFDEVNLPNPIYGFVSKLTADTVLNQSMASIVLDKPLVNGLNSIQNFTGSIETVSKIKYSIDFDYLVNDRQIILSKFMGKNIYLIDTGTINFDNLNKELRLDLNFSINPKILHSTSLKLPEQITSQVKNFIGWQNIVLNASLENFDLLNLDNLILSDKSEILLQGMYELDLNLLEGILDKKLLPSEYKISLIKDKKIINLQINELSNDIFSIDNGNITSNNLSFDKGNAEIPLRIEKDIIISFFKKLFTLDNLKDARILGLLDEFLVEKQKIDTSFSFNSSGKQLNEIFSDTSIKFEAPLKIDYVFDGREIPNQISGDINYKFNFYNLEKSQVNFDGEVNLDNSEAYVRQINLSKLRSDSLDIKFTGLLDKNNDSVVEFESIGEPIDLKGKLRLSSDNHIYFDQITINNSDNVKLSINGDLSKRELNMFITGDVIDLSQNKIEYKKINKFYLNKESYKINTNSVIFNGNIKVDNFKATIDKEKLNLKVHSGANSGTSYLKYTRDKSENEDTNIIYSNNISDFVSEDHTAHKLLSDGDIQMISVRNLDSLRASVDIKLNDFVLINSPASLKLLSLPSISGLVSIAEGEQGIRFGYGDIKYEETEQEFKNIEAFAVSDSLGLVMDGDIDRETKSINMKGEISPIHLINAIIQKVPLLGNIIVGNEGEGLFSIDFKLTGSSEDPDVESNPLTIIKPRILERAGEFLQNLENTNQE